MHAHCNCLVIKSAGLLDAASGNAIASATGGTGTITARGTPSGCGQAVTSGPNTFAAASTTGPADIQIQWGLPPAGNAPVSSTPVNACPGTLLTFKWPSPVGPADTRSYGVVQIPSASCSAISAPTAVPPHFGNNFCNCTCFGASTAHVSVGYEYILHGP